MKNFDKMLVEHNKRMDEIGEKYKIEMDNNIDKLTEEHRIKMDKRIDKSLDDAFKKIQAVFFVIFTIFLIMALCSTWFQEFIINLAK